jgi:hypothetical protein
MVCGEAVHLHRRHEPQVERDPDRPLRGQPDATRARQAGRGPPAATDPSPTAVHWRRPVHGRGPWGFGRAPGGLRGRRSGLDYAVVAALELEQRGAAVRAHLRRRNVSRVAYLRGSSEGQLSAERQITSAGPAGRAAGGQGGQGGRRTSPRKSAMGRMRWPA